MPFFDGTDLGDPQSLAMTGFLSGLAGGFGQAAMPSRAPVPFGAALGLAAGAGNEGAQAGASKALALSKGQQELQSGAIGLDQQTIMEGILRQALGLPPAGKVGNKITPPIFGVPTPSSATSAPSAPAVQDIAPTPAGAPSGSDNPAMGNMLVNKMLGFPPTEYAKAKAYADSLAPGTEKVEAERAAAKAAGINISGDVRQGGVTTIWNPNKKMPDGSTGGYDVAFKNPTLPEGYTLDDNGNAVQVPGGPAAVSDISGREAEAHAQFKPVTVYDKAGNEYTMPATALSKVAATPAPPSAGTSYAQRVAQLESSNNPDAGSPKSGQTASGLDQFTNATWLQQAKKFLPPQVIQGKSDQDILALRSNPQVQTFLTNSYAQDNAPQLQAAGIKSVGPTELYIAHHFGPAGAATILKSPVNTPLAQILPPQVLQANPDLQGATVADVYAHANQAMKGITMPTPGANGPVQPSVASPNTPVAHSNLGIPTKLDDFLGQIGPNYQPPGRPDAPAGALLGEPGKGQEEIQNADGERVEQYSKEAAGGQKIYTNLQQLYQIMGRGLSTGNITAEATHLTGLARQMGLSNYIPKNFDPNDAGAFNKLATDLVFSQLKQIGGRPMVSEIEGLRQANPNTALTPAANTEILNNILTDQRWRDARADLGRQYMARFGSLGDFDARFNEKYPETDAYNRIAGAAQKAGWTVPGSPGTPSGGKTVKIDPQKQAMITPQAIAETAKLHGATVERVKADLAAAGYTVP